MKRMFVSFMLLVMTAVTASAELTVFAASSLREPFIELGEIYEQRYGEQVRFNFAGSQTLRTQIEFGAPADLYAAANPMIIRPLVQKSLVEDVRYFAGNRLILLLSKRQSQIQHISELTAKNIQIALGNKAVPIGQYTRQLLRGMENDPAYGREMVAAIWGNVRTEESSVKAIVTKVLLDEVDAGIVYRSDLIADVRAKTAHLELPMTYNPLVRYPAAVIRDSRNAESARQFLELLLTPAGQGVFRRNGFLAAETGGGK